MLGKYLTHSDASPEVGAEQIRVGTGHMGIVALGTLVGAAGESENQAGFSAMSDKRHPVKLT